jgi:uncharacterized protein YjbJ (UPF0337 family)
MKPQVRLNRESAKRSARKSYRAKVLVKELKGDAQQVKGDTKNAIKDGVNKVADATNKKL